MGKTAMVWGANGGIGRALVAQLCAAGWQVVAVARNTAALDTLTPHVLEADVANDYTVQAAVLQAAQLVDAIDLWVYAAGDIQVARVADQTPGDWRRILDANLTGAYLTTHHSLPLLAADAHLFYIGAMSERLRLPGLAAYAAAKAGLEAYVEALGKEERTRRVTLVRPGAVDTPFWRKTPLRLPKQALTPDVVAEHILLGHAEGRRGVWDL